jgi:hypothetical protein
MILIVAIFYIRLTIIILQKIKIDTARLTAKTASMHRQFTISLIVQVISEIFMTSSDYYYLSLYNTIKL